MGGDQQGVIESRTRGTGRVDRKETTRGQRIMVVERGSEGGDKS